MDIAKLSSEMAQDSLMNAVGTTMLSKSLDAAQSNADGLARLMESAAAPLPEGSGRKVDLFA